MFENLKLNIYKDKIEGFAYDICHEGYAKYIIQTYLVVNINDKYHFLKHKKHNFNLDLLMEDMIERLEDIGYKPLTYWATNNQKAKIKAKNEQHQNLVL